MRRFRQFAAFFVFVVVFLSASAAFAQDASPAPAGAAWWTAFVPIAWFLLTAVVNTIARYATPADIDAWAERQPRLAALLSIFRRAGFEPIPFMQEIDNFFAGNPPPPGHAAALGRVRKVPPATPANDQTSARGFSELGVMVRLWWGALLLAACGLLAAAPDLAKLGVCEAGIAQAQPGLSFPAFMAASLAKCGQEAGITVLDLLEAILASTDPTLAPFKEEARLTKGDPARLSALRAKLGGHR